MSSEEVYQALGGRQASSECSGSKGSQGSLGVEALDCCCCRECLGGEALGSRTYSGGEALNALAQRRGLTFRDLPLYCRVHDLVSGFIRKLQDATIGELCLPRH